MDALLMHAIMQFHRIDKALSNSQYLQGKRE